MNIQEIKDAIEAGKKVCCGSSAYVVGLFPSWISPLSTGLSVTFIGNGYQIGLDEKSLDDCFIFGE